MNPFEAQPETLNPNESTARAAGRYEMPDRTRGNLAFNQLALIQTLGVDLETIKTKGLVWYFDESPDWLDDIQIVLHVSLLTPAELVMARISAGAVLEGAVDFFTERNVLPYTPEFEKWRAVFRVMLRDALGMEGEPATGKKNEAGKAEKRGTPTDSPAG